MRTQGHTAQREHAVALFSKTGEHAAIWFGLGGAGYALSKPGSPRRKAWTRGLAATAAAYGINTAIKYSVKRPRPTLEGLPPLTGVVSGLSFPSAHSTTAFAAAGAYSKALPAFCAPLLYGTAALFAASRPYLGVHYPSDVVAGAGLGTVIAKVATCRS